MLLVMKECIYPNVRLHLFEDLQIFLDELYIHSINNNNNVYLIDPCGEIALSDPLTQWAATKRAHQGAVRRDSTLLRGTSG